jgi:hypothetical protein
MQELTYWAPPPPLAFYLNRDQHRSSVVFQDLGVSPGSSITGFGPGIVQGTIHNNDAVAAQGQADALTAYGIFAGLAPTQNLTGQDLGGLTLDAGVYKFDSSAQLTGALTLDFQGSNSPAVLSLFESYRIPQRATRGRDRAGPQMAGSVEARLEVHRAIGVANF